MKKLAIIFLFLVFAGIVFWAIEGSFENVAPTGENSQKPVAEA